MTVIGISLWVLLGGAQALFRPTRSEYKCWLWFLRASLCLWRPITWMASVLFLAAWPVLSLRVPVEFWDELEEAQEEFDS